ncbi:hypothetical protein B0T17DRAFT_606099 [Bombardia bombarda]|uniref:SET domain-containing protein n=1 Tax=Bombardia bombarda TaxID=252184 RepID=A0AA39X6Z7_9PEZI|nr:hypothetical protein B0T17DRAFT_606099 [Bombardia bombarda]
MGKKKSKDNNTNKADSQGATGFDAAKQGKIPAKWYPQAPKNDPAVRLGLVNASVGYGLFAARDFAKGEFIFHEAPLMTALFKENSSADEATVNSQHRAYADILTDTHKTQVLNVAFPLLAARNGFPPPAFAQARQTLDADLGMNLVHGRYAGTDLTEEQYQSYTNALADACMNFFKFYAFEDKTNPDGVLLPIIKMANGAPAPTTHACVYLLGSLVNHCCTPRTPKRTTTVEGDAHDILRGATRRPPIGPNIEWRIGDSGLAKFVKPRHIAVQARRDIKAGEQLTWDYGKREKGFLCECDVCHAKLTDSLCGVL